MDRDQADLEALLNGNKLVEGGYATHVAAREDLDMITRVTAVIAGAALDSKVLRELRIGATLELQVGYGAKIERRIPCKVEGIDETFDTDSGLMLTLNATGLLAKLQHKIRSKHWDKTLPQAIRSIAQEHNWTAKIDNVPTTKESFFQNNVSDAAFLSEQAELYHCRITLDDKILYFGRELFKTPLAVTAGEIESLSVSQSIQNTLTEVTAMGWIPGTNKEVVGKASENDLRKISGDRCATAVFQECWGTRQRVMDGQKIPTDKDIQERAVSVLRKEAETFLSGSVHCLGRPEARPGMTLELSGLERWNGSYLIRSVHHEASATSFMTTLEFYSDSLPKEMK